MATAKLSVAVSQANDVFQYVCTVYTSAPSAAGQTVDAIETKVISGVDTDSVFDTDLTVGTDYYLGIYQDINVNKSLTTENVYQDLGAEPVTTEWNDLTDIASWKSVGPFQLTEDETQYVKLVTDPANDPDNPASPPA